MTGIKVTLARASSLATLWLIEKRFHALAMIPGAVARRLLKRRRGVMIQT